MSTGALAPAQEWKVHEIARRMRRSTQFVYAEIRRHHLAAVKVGRGWLITEADYQKYLADRRTTVVDPVHRSGLSKRSRARLARGQV